MSPSGPRSSASARATAARTSATGAVERAHARRARGTPSEPARSRARDRPRTRTGRDSRATTRGSRTACACRATRSAPWRRAHQRGAHREEVRLLDVGRHHRRRARPTARSRLSALRTTPASRVMIRWSSSRIGAAARRRAVRARRRAGACPRSIPRSTPVASGESLPAGDRLDRRAPRTPGSPTTSSTPGGSRRGRRCTRLPRTPRGRGASSRRRGRCRRHHTGSAPPAPPAASRGWGRDRRSGRRARSWGNARREPVDAGGVEPQVVEPALVEPAADRAGDHVARREIAERVLGGHERLALVVAQDRALAAQRLREQAGAASTGGAAPWGGTA